MAHEKILFLGSEDSPLITWLREQGEQVIQTADKLSAEDVAEQGYSFLVSYGYRHILRKDILDVFLDRAINLHISYLPWNRGADPNLWSFIEDTPKGVTIHHLDEGVDTGAIIVQEKMEFDSDRETLATSYEKLQAAIQELFKKNWGNIKSGNCRIQKQVGTKSMTRQVYHTYSQTAGIPLCRCWRNMQQRRRCQSSSGTSMTPKLKKSGSRKSHNKALHRTTIPLRSIAAGELDRCAYEHLKGIKERK